MTVIIGSREIGGNDKEVENRLRRGSNKTLNRIFKPAV